MGLDLPFNLTIGGTGFGVGVGCGVGVGVGRPLQLGSIPVVGNATQGLNGPVLFLQGLVDRLPFLGASSSLGVRVGMTACWRRTRERACDAVPLTVQAQGAESDWDMDLGLELLQNRAHAKHLATVPD